MAPLSATVDDPAVDAAPEARLLRVVEDLARELNPARPPPRATLDSALDRELGFDSLGRAELLIRVEREFGVALPERLLGDAETPRDLLVAALARRPGAAPPTAERVSHLEPRGFATAP